MRFGVVTRLALFSVLLLSLGSTPHDTLDPCRGPHPSLAIWAGAECYRGLDLVAPPVFVSMTHDTQNSNTATDHTIQIGASADGGDISPVSGNLLVQFTIVDDAGTQTEAGLLCDTTDEVWTKLLADTGPASTFMVLVCYRISTGAESAITLAFDGGASEQSQTVAFQFSGATSITCGVPRSGTSPSPVIPPGHAKERDLTVHFAAIDAQTIVESDSAAEMTSCTAGQMTVRRSSSTLASVIMAACSVSPEYRAGDTWTDLSSISPFDQEWLGFNCLVSP